METRRIHEVVHSLRQKPVHVRERIALGTACGVTLLVALAWIGVSATTGAFSLAPQTYVATQSLNAHTDEFKEASETGRNSFNNLLGAAGAAFGASSTPAEITIVNTEVRSTLDRPAVDPNATVIHF